MDIIETEKRLWGEGNSGFTKESCTRSNHRQRKPQVCLLIQCPSRQHHSPHTISTFHWDTPYTLQLGGDKILILLSQCGPSNVPSE